MTAQQGDDTGAGAALPVGAATSNLRQRAISAVVLAPLVIAAAYFGGWLFVCVGLIAACLILWEWTVLIGRDADLRVLAPGATALIVAAILVGTHEPSAGIAMIVVGAVLAAGSTAIFPRRYPAPNRPRWAAGGVVYAGVALFGPLALRADPQWGLTALLFLFATVWATDIFAYLLGRTIGGPLLWPALSPRKTWSGAAGGLAGGVAAGTLVAYAAGTQPVVASVVALVLSVVAQGGDLLESAIKRRFGAKDTSGLIPGHGGIMDRLDGFLAAALAATVIGALHQSLLEPARGLLVW